MPISTIKAGEGFTIDQVLNSNGFTLDTTDFMDYNIGDEDFERTIRLSNQDIQRLTNLDDGDENPCSIQQKDATAFVGMSFDELRSRMTSLTEDNKVMKLLKKEGTGELVPGDAQVTVEYVGYFEYHDEPFDSTLFHREKKLVTNLGKGMIIPGLEIAIKSMKKYEISLFLIDPDYAYGKLGCPPRIPENAEALFKVELKDFLDNGAAELYDELTNEDKKKFSVVEKIARDLLTTANENFKRRKYRQAMREYERVVSYLENASLDDDKEEELMNKHLVRALQNLVICYNKPEINKPKVACARYQRLESVDEDPNSKARYQYAKALFHLGDYDDAMKQLHIALGKSPGNTEIQNLMREVEGKRSAYAESCRQFAMRSLRMTNGNTNEFEETALELCNDFLNNTEGVRQHIPPGLSTDEVSCIRRVAASKGLTLVKHTRYNEESYYLSKH